MRALLIWLVLAAAAYAQCPPGVEFCPLDAAPKKTEIKQPTLAKPKINAPKRVVQVCPFCGKPVNPMYKIVPRRAPMRYTSQRPVQPAPQVIVFYFWVY